MQATVREIEEKKSKKKSELSGRRLELSGFRAHGKRKGAIGLRVEQRKKGAIGFIGNSQDKNSRSNMGAFRRRFSFGQSCEGK